MALSNFLTASELLYSFIALSYSSFFSLASFSNSSFSSFVASFHILVSFADTSENLALPISLTTPSRLALTKRK